MRAVPDLPYRDFLYPLNVFMHILTNEEGGVANLHYGFFEEADEAISVAQERSTELLLRRLPPPPARLLEVGIGLGTTLARLTRQGYDVEGITPDVKQIEVVRSRHGDSVRAHAAAFESFDAQGTYDCIIFQESAQYIDAEQLFSKARDLTSFVVVLDEFALRPLDTPGALHSRERFLSAAEKNGFRVDEELDVSAKAAPTIEYFTRRLPSWRERLIQDLGLTSAQIDELIESGKTYADRYRSGEYGYRLFTFRR